MDPNLGAVGRRTLGRKRPAGSVGRRVGRLGCPQKMANMILFLASGLASCVTGAAFVADGGQTAKTGSPSFIPD